MEKELRILDVVAAIICSAEGKVLAAQCPSTKHDGGWEFPGGKVEPGEALSAALVREISEELALDIAVEKLLCTVERDYPAYHVRLHCFICHLLGGELVLREHAAVRWLAVDELDAVDWLPADEDVLPLLRKELTRV